ncbi:Flagellar hook-associated 2 domain protein [Verrucomicrobia bacterium]|nr:Flagellar hook-associated 2 domain protein [Verrucomicrobiota bacterium]
MISGLASGFNWQTVVNELVALDEVPEQQLQAQQSTIQQQQAALSGIQAALKTLESDVSKLAGPGFFSSRTATPSNTNLASATADAGTGIGTYSFDVSQLATTAVLAGTKAVSSPLSASGDVSGLTLSSAAFATPVTAGTFMVNGQQITIATSDTLQAVFDKISTATNGTVTASYSATTDKITLSSSSPIVLGSATDTSNFLQVAQLSNNGTGTVTSANKLGAVNIAAPADQSNLATVITDGGSGAGAFKINGVTIGFNASNDSITNIINRINQSGAGVTASYNATTNQFTLTDQTTGDVGIAAQDVTGNFLAATGLAGGTLQRGQNLLYTVNGGSQLSSEANTISAESSGVTGLSVTALGTGLFTVQVGAATSSIASAITAFVTQYNTVQSLIDTQTAPTTDASGKITAGLLEGDNVVYGLTNTLQQTMNGVVPGLSGAIRQLASLGFETNSNNATLSTTDTTTLNNALATNLAGVQALFTNANTGLAVQMNTYLTQAISDTGSLATEETSLTNQSKDITTQINAIQAQAQADQTKYTNEFIAMETAESQINSQMAYLNATFGLNGSTSGASSSSSSTSSSG